MKTKILACALLVLTACSKHEQPVPANASAAAEDAAPMKVDLPAGAYTLDKSHASLIFRVNHLGFSNYTGRFKQFDANLQFDPNDFGAASIVVDVDPRSLDVENPPAGFLDELIGEQWLDTGRFPQLTFRSTSVTQTGTNTMTIDGALTLRGVTHPVKLEARFNGGYAGHPMDPHARIGFSARGTFKRSDFGIAYGIPAPGTTMGVGDDVEVIVETEFSGPAWTASEGG